MPENSVHDQAAPTTDTFGARKIPPRLADRLDLHDAARSVDNLPALKNQLQLAMEMLQQAMEQNLAAERRRMRRMLTGFVLLIALLFSGMLAGMGWFMLQMQARLAVLPAFAMPRSQPPAPATIPASSVLPAAIAPSVPVPASAPPPEPVAPAAPVAPIPALNTGILDALQTDLLAVEERSRALDDLLAVQNSRLQAIMDEVLDLNNDLVPASPTAQPVLSPVPPAGME